MIQRMIPQILTTFHRHSNHLVLRLLQILIIVFVLAAALQLPIEQFVSTNATDSLTLSQSTQLTKWRTMLWSEPATAQAAPLSPGVLTQMVPPTFTVSINSAHTGVTNGVCVSLLNTCPTVTDQNALIDSDTTNGARLTVPIAVGASVRVAAVESSSYSAGHFAGFVLRDEANLGLGVLNGITIRTYENNVFREEKSASSLLDLPLLNNVHTVGFETALSFDEIQIEVSSIVGALLDYTVYYAVVRTPLPMFTLEKSAPTTAARNSVFAYTLTLTNTGYADTNGTIVVSDDLPTNVSPIGTSASNNFDCSLSSTITCTIDQSLAVGASATSLRLPQS